MSFNDPFRLQLSAYSIEGRNALTVMQELLTKISTSKLLRFIQMSSTTFYKWERNPKVNENQVELLAQLAKKYLK